MLLPFEKSSYLAQVRRLRHLANLALQNYKIGKYQLDFINHGENTTFKVICKKGKFLLRVHRDGYHTNSAIKEELNWLRKLTKTGLRNQIPVPNNSGKILTNVCSEAVGAARTCDLLTWCEGSMRGCSTSSADFYKLGELVGFLHNHTEKSKVKFRNYWDADGLIGSRTKFGNLEDLKSVIPEKYHIISRARKKALSKIKRYQIQNSQKMGMIHADLHFGNLIWDQTGVVPIDFDDCGFGFHMYDLCIPLYGLAVRGIKKSLCNELRSSLFEGYRTLRSLSRNDMEIVDTFILARRITILAWLHERRENPRLNEYFKKMISKELRFIEKSI